MTEILNKVKWGEFRLGDLFEIQSTLSFNKERLTNGDEYDYVTRTSQNQGILQRTGFVNQENINPAGNWSLGLLQMDFFYRENPWYAGQFVRKITPKKLIAEKLNKRSIIYFSTILNKQKDRLLSVLVRDVDKVFQNIKVQLPTQNEKINFDFMENFVAELEAQRTAELEAYLSAAGLKDYTLTTEEERTLAALENREITFIEYKVVDLFTVKNTNNILSRDVTPNSGNTPYLSASRENNAVSSYISHRENLIDKGNCIFIGGKTFVVTYQAEDFYSNDSHNLCLYLKEKEEASKLNQLCIISCIERNLGHKYSWGDSISNKKIQTDTVFLPSKNGKPDYAYMQTLISAVQKQVIKDVVRYADEKIAATKTVTAR